MSKVVILDKELSGVNVKNITMDGMVMKPYRMTMELDEENGEVTTSTYLYEGGYEYKTHILTQTEQCTAEQAKQAAEIFQQAVL